MKKNKKIHAIIQAREGSIRLPNKVLRKLGNNSVVELINKRLKKSKYLDEIIFAIPKEGNAQKLKKHLVSIKALIYEGSEYDVIDRYYKCAKSYSSDIVVRITADCPFVDYKLVDSFINKFLKKRCDYLSNTLVPTFPDGMDIEIFSKQSLKKAWDYSRKHEGYREHVTTYIKENKINFNIINVESKKNYSFLRLTLDEENDYKLLKKVQILFKSNIYFTYEDIIKLYMKNKKVFKLNSHIKRDEGSIINNNQKFWKRAKNSIPEGNMLLSKRPNFYLTNKWPIYFNKAKGCKIWDIDNKSYLDFSLMGVGTNILGYANNTIDKQIKKVIEDGNICTLNNKEDVYLAEKLIDLHPWSEACKFARTGGEANSIAIRLARASTGKDKILACGYHGWHDWYLAANLSNKNNLNNHLSKNLKVSGVPKKLKDSILTFEFNDLKKFKNLVNKNNGIAAVIMEVKRDIDPNINFLKEIRKITKRKGIVLIFDECTSGFRENFGGLHLKYNINPDMAMFGKALGNGYPITAILGKKDVMNSIGKTFISSTYWTDRIGPTAGIATLNEMERLESWKLITNKGNYLRSNLSKITKMNGFSIKFSGLKSILKFNFDKNTDKDFINYISNLFLKRGILSKNSIYVSTSHTKKIIDRYLDNFNQILIGLNK